MLQQLQNAQGPNIRHNKKIFIIIFIYFAINIIAKWSSKDHLPYKKIIEKINNQAVKIQANDLIYIFEYQESYEGTWNRVEQLNNKNRNFLQKDIGIFEMRLIRLFQVHNSSYFDIVFRIIDGQYIDDGIIQYQFRCSNQEFDASIINSTMQILSLKNNTYLEGKYDQDDLFITKDIGPINASVFDITFSLTQKNKLELKISLATQQVNLQLQLNNNGNKFLKTITFAVIMFIISYYPFNALIYIISSISNGTQSSSNFSLLTICLTSMWDTVICLVAFVFAFSTQQNLILFIIPAFLMCLIFTNLEPKLMILIFQARANQNNTQSYICKFNLIHYGSLILIYPLIILMNFNRLFFILASCLIFPQIYLNGINGVRPNPNSRYYLHFLLFRFILIFYIKCYPANIFKFKPDFLLGLICLCIISIQYLLINLQKSYGPKKIMPKFLLPSVYNYQSQQQFNLQDGSQIVQCAICLTPLNNQPPPSPIQNQIQIQYPVMKTPCKHTYHTSCLIQWMKIKQDCPQCRFRLPPYE